MSVISLMVFTTHIFVFYFLPLVLVVYYALPALLAFLGAGERAQSRARNLWLGYEGWQLVPLPDRVAVAQRGDSASGRSRP